jgi:hypothetical protein
VRVIWVAVVIGLLIVVVAAVRIAYGAHVRKQRDVLEYEKWTLVFATKSELVFDIVVVVLGLALAIYGLVV